MDIFGKPSSVSNKQKSPFQNELAAKMKDRKSRGLAADLTETEEEDDDDEALASDDDLLAAFTMKSANPERPSSQSPWRSEEKAKAQPPKPQTRTSLLDNKQQKQKIPIKPKNELDRLLSDDVDEVDSLQVQSKSWQPPKFKDFSVERNVSTPPKPEDRSTKQSPLLRKSPRLQSSIREDEDESDDELTGAYAHQLEQRSSPFGGQTPTDRLGSFPPTSQKNPFDERSRLGRMSPKSEDQFGGGKPQKPSNNLNDIFGARKSPTDKNLFSNKKFVDGKEKKSMEHSGRKTPTDFTGRKTPQADITERRTPQADVTGRKTPQADVTGRKTPQADVTGRKTPQADVTGRKTPQADVTGRKTPPADVTGRRTSQADINGRGSPKQESQSRKSPESQSLSRQRSVGRDGSAKQSTMDDIFGAKKRAESPLLLTNQRRPSGSSSERTSHFDQGQTRQQPGVKKGSYMSNLLAESDEERDQTFSRAPNTKSSYLDSLLGGKKEESAAPKTRSSYLDSLLDEEKREDVRDSRPRQRAPKGQDSGAAEERESSVCRDVDKDPIMIETMKKQREEKRQEQKGKTKTKSAQADFDIEEVADAQNSLTMTFIKPETTNSVNQRKAITKPKLRKAGGDSCSPNSSEMSFESATDIRNYIYKEWSEKKREASKMSIKEKKRLEKEAELKKEKDKVDKKLENETIFRTWKERKDQTLKGQLRNKKRNEEKEKEKLHKEQEKKDDAAKIFQKWKESKDEQIIENRQKERKSQASTLEGKQEIEARKQKEAEGAFSGWKKQKDKEIRRTKNQDKLVIQQESTQKMRDTREREIEAEELYDRWLQKKEEQSRREKAANKRRNSYQSPRPAWSPANKTIPCGR